MQASPTLSLFEMFSCMSSALDLVSPSIVNHQKNTAFMSHAVGKEMNLGNTRLSALVLAGILHDCGALSLRTKLDCLNFESEKTDLGNHAELGHGFFTRLETLFPELIELDLPSTVRYHHLPWDHGRGAEHQGNGVPLESQIIHLADRVEVLVNHKVDILEQSGGIVKRIRSQSGRMFKPQVVEAFEEASRKESFWLNLRYPDYLKKNLGLGNEHLPQLKLDLDGMQNLARVFGQIVDYRSTFTATHSTGVAEVARYLAELAGFSPKQVKLMQVAGYLHDLGKLAVPKEILEKPGPLTTEEFNIMKAHPFHLPRLLGHIPALEQVVDWASHHHEHLDGAGYPDHLKAPDLNLGARIVAVADVFTALTEDRPYRAGLAAGQAVNELNSMVRQQKLDSNIVDMVSRNQEEISVLRAETQKFFHNDYCQLMAVA